MCKKTITTKGTYIKLAGSEECVCRVRETGKFNGSVTSEHKIENSCISDKVVGE